MQVKYKKYSSQVNILSTTVLNKKNVLLNSHSYEDTTCKIPYNMEIWTRVDVVQFVTGLVMDA